MKDIKARISEKEKELDKVCRELEELRIELTEGPLSKDLIGKFFVSKDLTQYMFVTNVRRSNQYDGVILIESITVSRSEGFLDMKSKMILHHLSKDGWIECDKLDFMININLLYRNIAYEVNKYTPVSATADTVG